MLSEMEPWEMDAWIVWRQMKDEASNLHHCNCKEHEAPAPCTTCGRPNLSPGMAWQSVFSLPKETK